jgi:hypothetical protein
MTRAEFEAACLREGYEVGEGEIQAHVRRQPHAHDFDARLFVVDGSLTLVRGEDRVTYGPGEVCAVPAVHRARGAVHGRMARAPGATGAAPPARASGPLTTSPAGQPRRRMIDLWRLGAGRAVRRL